MAGSLRSSRNVIQSTPPNVILRIPPNVILRIPPNVIQSTLPNVTLSGVEGWPTLCADTGCWLSPV